METVNPGCDHDMVHHTYDEVFNLASNPKGGVMSDSSSFLCSGLIGFSSDKKAEEKNRQKSQANKGNGESGSYLCKYCHVVT